MNSSIGLKASLLFISSLTVMAGATIAASLPQMAEVFGEYPNSKLLTQLLLTVPALSILFAAPFVGRIIDRSGRLKLLSVSVVLYAISGTTGLYLDNLYLLLAGRILLGISVGGTMTTVVTLVGDYFKGSEREGFLGFQSAVMAFGGMVFVGLGGVLADIHWRAPFWIYAISLIGIPLIFLFLKEPDRSAEQQQFAGSKEKAPGLIFLPMLTIFVVMLLFYIIPTQLPFFLKTINVEENSLAGLAMVCATGVSAMASLSYKRLKMRLSFSQIFAICFGISSIGFLVTSQADTFPIVAIGMSITGLGMGMFMPNTNNWVLSLAPDSVRGRYMGLNATFIFLGQFFSPLLASPVIKMTSFPTAFLIFAGLMVGISGFFIFFHFSRKQKNEGI